jgi:predicted enzyme related to lactoylglutathione lyase
MPDKASHPHLGIDYIEIPVLDMEATKAFYGASFGWRFNDYGPGYVGYVDGARGDQEAGGFRLEKEVKQGGALIVLYSRELEATVAKVREAGGKITKEIFDFPGGRRFEFADPSGNELGVWSDS